MNIEIETVTVSLPCNNNENNDSVKININKIKNDNNQNSQSFPIDENNNNSDVNKNETSNKNMIKIENLYMKSSSPPLLMSTSKTTTINVTSNSKDSANTTNTMPINNDIIPGETISSTANLNTSSHTNKTNSQTENNSNSTMKKNIEKPKALIEANDSSEMYLIVNTIKNLFPNVNIHLCFNNNIFKDGKLIIYIHKSY